MMKWLEFDPLFGYSGLKDRNKTSVFDSYISAEEEAPKDFRPVTYKDFEYKDQKLPDYTRRDYENIGQQEGILQPRQSLSELKYKDTNFLEELEKEYNIKQRAKQASQYPGYYGTQEKFMQGGIASLNVKK